MGNIDFVLFDAANTLIHKPELWGRIKMALAKHDISVDDQLLKIRHKLISELIRFPDNTSADFYRQFNSELLYSVGIIPTDVILDDVFAACTYLKWDTFEDTKALSNIALPKGILSNFNSSLTQRINTLIPDTFSKIIISEELQCAKPSLEFYTKALEIIGIPAKNILYIGDSIKLDMQPALEVGMNVLLIDRDNCYPDFKRRISSMHEISSFIN
jgi:putative hydrolase of the HAD superfamily